MEVSRAHPKQAEELSRIAWHAKAAWGYPERWLQLWSNALMITSEQIETGHYFTATWDGQIVGFCGLHCSENVWRLEHLWVLPERWKRGIGKRLFLRTVAFASSQHARVLTIEADPNAEAFYLHMGAERIGSVETVLDGARRVLPQMIYAIRDQSS